MGCIYSIELNGLLYVGMTLHTAKKRFNGHVYDANSRPPLAGKPRKNSRLHNAIRVHGHTEAVIQELVHSDDWEELKALEQKFILKLNTKSPNGYNLTLGGQGGLPKHTEETRKRISDFQRGRVHSAEQNRKISQAKMGHPVSQETRAKISAAVQGRGKGKIITEEHRKLISLANKGRKRTPEQCARIAAATKAAMTPEIRANLSRIKMGTSCAAGPHVIPYESKIKMMMGSALGRAKQNSIPYSEYRIN